MTVLTVLHYPDDRLRTVAKPVTEITAQTRQLVADMLDTMYDENGIGLAATQVNIHQRVVVIDISESRDQPQVFINPEIINKSGDTTYEEGCLSVPHKSALSQPSPNLPVSKLRRAFCKDSLNVRPIAMVSPTDFICVVRVVLASGNFSKAQRGILVTT